LPNEGVKSSFDSCSFFLAYQHVSFTRIDVKKLHEHWPGAGSTPGKYAAPMLNTLRCHWHEFNLASCHYRAPVERSSSSTG